MSLIRFSCLHTILLAGVKKSKREIQNLLRGAVYSVVATADLIIERDLDACLRDRAQTIIRDLLDRPRLSPRLRESLVLVSEALSTDDWSRWGAIIALLWSKLDQVVTALRKSNDQADRQQRSLDQVANEIRSLVTRLSR